MLSLRVVWPLRESMASSERARLLPRSDCSIQLASGLSLSRTKLLFGRPSGASSTPACTMARSSITRVCRGVLPPNAFDVLSQQNEPWRRRREHGRRRPKQMSGHYLCRVVRTQKPAVTPSAGLGVACLCRQRKRLIFLQNVFVLRALHQHDCGRQATRRGNVEHFISTLDDRDLAKPNMHHQCYRITVLCEARESMQPSALRRRWTAPSYCRTFPAFDGVGSEDGLVVASVCGSSNYYM